jgi:prefoldin alpha subunit
MLVPLTSSLYIPGKLQDIKKVMVDIGTGYYVEKSVTDADAFLKGKCAYLQKNLAMVHENVIAMKKQIAQVGAVIQQRVGQLREEGGQTQQ